MNSEISRVHLESSAEYGLATCMYGKYPGLGKEQGFLLYKYPYKYSPKENAAIAAFSKICREMREPRRIVSQYYSPFIFVLFWFLVNFPRIQVTNFLAVKRIKSVQFVS